MKKIKSTFKYLWGHKKLSIILLITIGVLAFFLWPKPPAEIETVKVKRGRIIQSITASGTVTSENTVNLSFLSSGKLIYLGAKKGDEVVAGQTIATLDQRTLRTSLKQALEDYAIQRNQFDETLEDNQNHTPQDALDSEMKRILENNQNNLDKAINSVELQNLTIEQSILSSPINGIVIRADAGVAGINIAPTTVFTIADPYSLVFNTEVDEADIAKIVINQPLKVTLEAFPKNTVPLNVTSIDFASHVSDSGANVYTVKASLPTDENYRIGMSGDAEIILNEASNTLIIPLSCLIDETHVYVKKDNTFEKREITTGLQSDTDIEVKKGLTDEEIVALIPEDVEKIIEKK